MQAGTVVQTVIHAFTDTTTNSTDSNADLTGSSFSFTPKTCIKSIIDTFKKLMFQLRLARNSNAGQGCTINVVHDGRAIQETLKIMSSIAMKANGRAIYFQRKA